MGIDQIRRFKCTACNYQASVYGETDDRYTHVLETVICNNCKEVIEVTVKSTREKEGVELDEDCPFPEMEQVSEEPFCMVCEKNNLSPWNKQCPKCDGTMALSHLDWRIWNDIDQTVNIINDNEDVE